MATVPTGSKSWIIEAENFDDVGGWTVDQQSMDVMGSPYLIAHGYGKPVRDAVTKTTLPESGRYRVWVRTRDWPAQFGLENECGTFRVLVNGKPLQPVFGTEKSGWHWQDGGVVDVENPQISLKLQDLDGFDGRCDAVLFAADPDALPPEDENELDVLRRKLRGLPETPTEAGTFDFVVIGGGIAGICAAVAAARAGLQVALLHDRPVLGGNNSSEVRVHIGGERNLEPFPALGNIVNEVIPSVDRGNARSEELYEDEKKMQVVQQEPNISLALNLHVVDVEAADGNIHAVVGEDVISGERFRYTASLFADCTGDATVGYLSGADYRVGRESQARTGERLAPEKPDAMVMGPSVMWYAEQTENESPFPDQPWSCRFNESACSPAERGDWNWEAGMYQDQICDIEDIRDYGLRVAYGNWAFLKNHSQHKEEYRNHRLAWVGCIAGKRESRRLLGDVILTQQDVEEQRDFPDACVTTTWSIDLHYPKEMPGFEDAPFRSYAEHIKKPPYPIPFRCLYSRNVDNLMMAGRNISVTHVALGTTRVMGTCGMMGEVIGVAAGLCRESNTLPRNVYQDHLQELFRRFQPETTT